MKPAKSLNNIEFWQPLKPTRDENSNARTTAS